MMDSATDGTACANSLSGHHEAYTIEQLRARGVPGRALMDASGVPYIVESAFACRITCTQCGAHRLDDFEIITSRVNGVWRFTFLNRTGRAVFATFDGVQYEFTASRDGVGEVATVKIRPDI